MEIELQQAGINDKPVLRNLMELYNYDFSEFENSDVDEHGLFGYRYLDHYWTDQDRDAFLIRVDGRLAGFALVRTIHDGPGGVINSIAEFFVMRKYRRHGVGREVARRIFDLFPGRWRIAQEAGNLPAQAFWRRIISEYTAGDFDEVSTDNEEWRGVVHTFRIKIPDIL